ncbi:polysaccharide deacetylase family protein [Tissierella sp. MB52-C2]|uniref:polysaccharide deacetylase family protein n=1 Tax=Tissierella sp. MB52-C2 TaxID=3070999 RepID=UPI00280ACF09|nr:polysaccharide deacetylase family protein [Tissierella sp. MB52-C2]WMM26512.1 polysaccharide deacetylase family protein [Tissierella sp. MB52-C2]
MIKKPLRIKIIFLVAFLAISAFSIKYVISVSTNGSKDYNVNIVRNGSKQQKFIALTFDDGPHPQYTPEILDLLDQYNIKATFFVLGQFAEKYPDIIKRQAEEGHEIGNHTYSHINIKKASTQTFKEEFDKTQSIIFSLTGAKSKVFRPPYGLYNENTMKIISDESCDIVLWSSRQDSKDWSNPSVDKIVSNTISNIENGDIVLFHDYIYYETSNTVEALKLILPELINKGYKFVTISELVKLSHY